MEFSVRKEILKVSSKIIVLVWGVSLAIFSYGQNSSMSHSGTEKNNLDANILNIKGTWQQGQLLIGKTRPGTEITFDDNNVHVDEEGIFVFGLGRDQGEVAELIVVDPKGKKSTHLFDVKQREYNIQRINGVPQRTVTPPEEELKRIRQEGAMMRKARQIHSSRKDFLQDFQWPVTGPISGVYGSQRVYNGKPGRPHFGVDVARPVGTQVVAPANGIVTLAHDEMFYNGGTLVIDHGRGIASTFIHLNKVLVKAGQEVKQGDLIAEIGATGRATGPHLDWRINWFSRPLDPVLIVPPMPDDSTNINAE